jgi:membrane-bound metal-dependent hydrolase YbcI (DUF457 family)
MAGVVILALLLMVAVWRQKWYHVAALFAIALAGYWLAVLLDSVLIGLAGYGALSAGAYALGEKLYTDWWL